MNAYYKFRELFNQIDIHRYTNTLINNVPIGLNYRNINYNDRKIGFIYFISGFGDFIKIGYSKYVSTRLATLQLSTPKKLNLEHLFFTNFVTVTESYFHNLYRDYHIAGELFRINDFSFVKNIITFDGISLYNDIKKLRMRKAIVLK